MDSFCWRHSKAIPAFWSEKMTNVKPLTKGRNIRQFFKHHTANDKHQILIQVESFSKRQLKTILMDKKLRETTNLYVELKNSKRKVKGATLGTNSLLPFDVNVMPTTHNIVGWYILRPFAHPVASCCMLLGVVTQILKSVKLLATWKPNTVGQQLLGVVGLGPFARSVTNARRMPGKGSGMGTLGRISFKRIILFFWNAAFPLSFDSAVPSPSLLGSWKHYHVGSAEDELLSGNSIEAGYYERQIWQPFPLFLITLKKLVAALVTFDKKFVWEKVQKARWWQRPDAFCPE